ncbi:hypothetical protein [Streptomyces sp. NPDC088915]|uniref:hypothetical protein n=1 Tax=Streptomyces sp. NPDC088915 TaxID=3365912 RepID=UPI00382E45B6
MTPSRTTRLTLLDRAETPEINDAAFRRFYRLTRTADFGTWYTCGEIAELWGIGHHQARPTLGALVAGGLLERSFEPHRLRGSDRRIITYRLLLPTETAGGTQ